MAQLSNKQNIRNVMFSIDNDVNVDEEDNNSSNSSNGSNNSKKQKVIEADEDTDVFISNNDVKASAANWKEANAYFNLMGMFTQQAIVFDGIDAKQQLENVKEILEIGIRIIDIKLAATPCPCPRDTTVGEYSDFDYGDDDDDNDDDVVADVEAKDETEEE